MLEVRRVSDGVMSVVFEEDVKRFFEGMLHNVEEVWKKSSLFMTG